MLTVTVGKQLTPVKGETNAPFKAKGTIDSERTKGDATVVVQDLGNGQAQLVVDDRQKTTIGKHQVGQYVDEHNGLPFTHVADIPAVPAPTAENPTATTPGKLAEGVVLVFQPPVIVPVVKQPAKPKEQQVFQ